MDATIDKSVNVDAVPQSIDAASVNSTSGGNVFTYSKPMIHNKGPVGR
jgi:hypothetical protein